MKRLAVLIATFGYVGHFPFAPGTAGSLAAFLLYVPLRWAAAPGLDLAVTVGLFAAGIWAAGQAEGHYGRTDPGYIVVDEVVGMLTTLLFLPVSWAGVLAGFFLFRAYDIVKPFPAGRCEQLHGGFGVMTDDLVAGIYGNLSLRVLIVLAPGVFTA